MGQVKGGVQHEIHLEEEEPIALSPIKIPLIYKDQVKEEIDSMIRQGVIRPSKSPWGFNMVLVDKPNGRKRVCVNFKKLNKVTKKDKFPMPNLHQTMGEMKRARKYSKIDLWSGFYQVPMRKEDIEKTAFYTPDGLYEFLVMPFGLCNAPATFQRLMNKVLKDYIGKICHVYMDDIIIFSDTEEEHLKHIRIIFQTLKNHGLFLKLQKCEFLKDEMTFLGHKIGKDGIRSDPKKIEAIVKLPPPRNVREVRKILGMCGWHRKFIEGYAKIAMPLWELTSDKEPFVWDERKQKAFDILKEKLISAPIMAHPILDQPYRLYTDASDEGLGATLTQIQEGKEKVIAYGSKALGKSQKNYPTTMKEALAIRWAVEHYNDYLGPQEFIIITDHSALATIKAEKNPKAMIARWMQHIDQYNYRVEHRKGRKMDHVDTLSRMPIGLPLDETKECLYNENKDETGGIIDWGSLSSNHEITDLENGDEVEEYLEEYSPDCEMCDNSQCLWYNHEYMEFDGNRIKEINNLQTEPWWNEANLGYVPQTYYENNFAMNEQYYNSVPEVDPEVTYLHQTPWWPIPDDE